VPLGAVIVTDGTFPSVSLLVVVFVRVKSTTATGLPGGTAAMCLMPDAVFTNIR
jgi:hypothetical protein